MIGSGLKKLANENAMTVSHGVAYGSLGGYAATMSEGSGYKQIIFSVRFTDPVKKAEFMSRISSIGDKQLYKDYRVNRLAVTDSTVQVIFHDAMGTMKKLRTFVDMFISLLEEYGATGANICSECGGEIADGTWIMVNGVCHHVHNACADKVDRAVESSNEQEKQERTGSYLSGAVGAFLGALLGAVVWAVVLYGGYVASIVGFVIGWLAEKGYTLLKGKTGKGKVAILILAIIFGVLVGTMAVDVVTLADMINSGELYGYTYGDIPFMIIIMLMEDSAYLTATLSNIGLGLVFATLGVFALVRKAGKEAAGTKFVKLN